MRGHPGLPDELAISGPVDGVVTLTMARPAKLNAMTAGFFAALPNVMRGLDDDDDCRVVVVAGAGGNFSAGGDMASFRELHSSDDYRRHMERAFAGLSAVAALSKPLVAAVEGVAYAGGLELASVCDVVVAGKSAKFCLPEVAIGLLPAFGLTHLADSIGRRRAGWLALTGHRLDADTALHWGLVQTVVPDGRALDEATISARELAALPQTSVRAIKAFLADPDLAAGIDRNVELFGTIEHRNAVEQFGQRGRSDA